MIEFVKRADVLILSYASDELDNRWLYQRLNDGQRHKLKGTFHVNKGDLIRSSVENDPDPEDLVEFKIGFKQEEYFLLDKNILSINFNLLIHKDVDLSQRSFTAAKNVSIFSRINELGIDEIRIGGDSPNSLPAEDFKRLIKTFPNTHELKRYVEARVSSVLRDFVDTKHDGESRYHKYMDKKLVATAGEDIVELFRDDEIEKYTIIRDKLTEMLNTELTYSETQWQLGILQIILLLYPKYIRVFNEVLVRDTYTNRNRRLDFLLVDSSGNTDIIEIKKPFDQCIMTNNQYRDNFVPRRDLSGTVMQIEKYIYYLNKWGPTGEELLTEKYKSELPEGFKIKITNPGGIIIMGRDSNLSKDQRQDFEVVRRKFRNVVDIITYDDLLRRLNFTLEQLKANVSASS